MAEQPTTTPTPAETSTGTLDQSVVDLGETARLGDVRARAFDARVLGSYFYLPFPDFIGVETSERHQFVLLSVDVEAAERYRFEPEDFAVVVGDRSYVGRSEGVWGLEGEPPQQYSAEEGRGLLVFEVPAPIEADECSVELDLGEETREPLTWRFDDDVVTALQRPPEFEVSAFEAPETVDAGEPIEVSATVANVGEGAGTFRAALNQEGDVLYGGTSTTFELRSGEERVWEETIDAHTGADRDQAVTVHLRFRSSGGDEDRDVRVRPNEATETQSTEG